MASGFALTSRVGDDPVTALATADPDATAAASGAAGSRVGPAGRTTVSMTWANRGNMRIKRMASLLGAWRGSPGRQRAYASPRWGAGRRARGVGRGVSLDPLGASRAPELDVPPAMGRRFTPMALSPLQLLPRCRRRRRHLRRRQSLVAAASAQRLLLQPLLLLLLTPGALGFPELAVREAPSLLRSLVLRERTP